MYTFISLLGTTFNIQKPKLIKKYDMCCENVHMVKVRFCDWLVLWDGLWCSVYGSNSPRTLNTCLSLSDESMSTIGCELTKKFDLCFKSVVWWKCDFLTVWWWNNATNALYPYLTCLECKTPLFLSLRNGEIHPGVNWCEKMTCGVNGENGEIHTTQQDDAGIAPGPVLGWI